MALTYVGGTTSSAIGSTGTNLTVSLTSLTGGVASAPAEGDIVIVSYATGSYTDRNLNVVTSGYTRRCDLFSNDSYDTNLWVATKIMGSTPDTSVVLPPSGSTSDAIAVNIQVWRASSGNTISVYDIQTATGANRGIPTPPAITPTRIGSVVISTGAYSFSSNTALTSSDLSNFVSVGSSGTNCVTIGLGSFAWTSGTFTPAQFGGGSTSSSASWCAFSLVIAEVYVNRNPLFTGCVGYYQFEGNSNDDSNAENDGTDTDITYSDVGGLQGKYASFNGTSSEINNFTDITIPQTNFAYSFWFKTSSASGKKIIGAENVLTGTTGVKYDKLVYIGTDGKLYSGVYNGGIRYIISSNTVNDNKWHHCVFTSSATTTYLYLDGSLVGSVAYVSADPGSVLRIASYKLTGWDNGSDGYYTGNIDQLGVWYKNLSADDVRTLYALPKTLHNGLISYWKLDGNSYDFVGKYDGTDTDITYNASYGKIGQGALCNGTSSAISFSPMDLPVTGWTISLWVKTSVTPSASTYPSIFNFRNANGTIFCSPSVGGLGCNFKDSTSTLLINASAGNIDDDLWHHVVVTMNGSGNPILVYLDGSIILTGNSASFTGNFNGIIPRISGNYTANYFSGYVDEVAIWNRALTGEEIQQVFYAGNGNTYPLQTNMADMM